MKNKMPKKVKHPWRKCPLGEHWVSEHSRNVPISERNPNGVTIVEGHCRRNSSRHEIFVADEIHDIATEYFKDLNNKPTPDALGFPKGNDYDNLIAGWTRFWNEVFQPEVPLDPNLIKALIASESGFNISAEAESSIGLAKGLIQITEQTRKILANQKGELKDIFNYIVQKRGIGPKFKHFYGNSVAVS